MTTGLSERGPLQIDGPHEFMNRKARAIGVLVVYPLLLLVSANCGKPIEIAEDEHFDVGSGLLDTSSSISKLNKAFEEIRIVSRRSALVSSTYTNTVEQLPTESTRGIRDEVRISDTGQTELDWIRVGDEQNESAWKAFKERVGLGSPGNSAGDNSDKGSVNFDSGRYIVSASVKGIDSTSVHSDLESSIEAMERSTKHRMLIGRIALGLDLPLPPSTDNLRHLGTTACGEAVTCDVFEWRPGYYGDRLTYRAYLNSATGRLIRLTERFLSGEKSNSYLVDEFVAGLEEGQTSR